jgi:DNA-binding NarL/FixJ family response regulator
MTLRLVVADDSLLFREGLCRLLVEAGFEVAAQACEVDGLLAAVEAQSPDVAIVDIRMPPTHTNEGLRAAVELKSMQPGIGVLVLSQYVETHHALRLVAGGAGGVGYLVKERVGDLAEFASAVRRVGDGELVVDQLVVEQLVDRRRHGDPLSALTARERDVLGLMAEGRSNLAIGDQLHLGNKTVETHVRSIFGKLELGATADDHRRVLAVLQYLRA